MSKSTLSTKAKQICKQNYNSNCSQCPLRPECTKTFNLSQESHNNWINSINDLAESISI